MSIEETKDRFETSLMRLRNVIGVGIGLRGGKQVIEVLVSKQINDASQVIPESVEGYPVEVVEVGDVTAHFDEEGSHGT